MKSLLVPKEIGGTLCPRAEVELLIYCPDQHGVQDNFEILRFIVDCASDLTTIPIPVADAFRIPFDRTKKLTVHTPGGNVPGYLGQIKGRFLGHDFNWPCAFTDSPPKNAPEPQLGIEGKPGSRRLTPKPKNVNDWENLFIGNPTDSLVLGRAGLLEEFHLCIKGKNLIINRNSLFGWLRTFWEGFSWVSVTGSWDQE